ncbi:MAG: thymidine phosphorylase [Pseudomonadota bacterium]
MLPQEIIAKKRDRLELSPDEIAEFVAGVTDGSVSEGQIAAFTMAVFLNGMARDEAVSLTLAMRDSGNVLDWSEHGDAIVDKHSTGGVGDNVSLMLAPAVAACGAFVPMISGRGLGHTGGTLDKFDSIPGYNTTPDDALFRSTVAEAGCAIIGQTGSLAPADKRIYSVRDVTATVESVPLITASILSKKLAAGLKGLVLDVKVGSGAFMTSVEDARELATSLVETAKGAGLNTTALMTDMDHPLASAAGNAVEMRNAIDFLTGRHVDDRLMEITCHLGAHMLVSAGISEDTKTGYSAMQQAFSSGQAAERFARMVVALGGPADILERPDKHLEPAPLQIELFAEPQHIETAKENLALDTRHVGLAVIELGGGRTRPQDPIDHAVGLTDIAGRDWDGSSPICVIHARDETSAEKAKKRILDAIGTGVETPKPILEIID